MLMLHLLTSLHIADGDRDSSCGGLAWPCKQRAVQSLQQPQAAVCCRPCMLVCTVQGQLARLAVHRNAHLCCCCTDGADMFHQWLWFPCAGCFSKWWHNSCWLPLHAGRAASAAVHGSMLLYPNQIYHVTYCYVTVPSSAWRNRFSLRQASQQVDMITHEAAGCSWPYVPC
jgi:hypothetical protein